MATDFFTVLSTGQRFTEDQWLNVQAFSMLRAWLLHSSSEGPGSPEAGGTRVGGREARGALRLSLAGTSGDAHAGHTSARAPRHLC